MNWQDWMETGLRWRSNNHAPEPRRVMLVDDSLSADQAFRWACEGTAMLWTGDFQNARQLLQAMARRLDRPARAKRDQPADLACDQLFHRHRQEQARRSRVLSQLLIPLNADYSVPLRRAPDARQACTQAWGEPDGALSRVSLREWQGLIGAYEWRKNGVRVPALHALREQHAHRTLDDNDIHPHYGVFSPVRGEYVDLVAQAPLPDTRLAFDIGVGTGVLSAVLALRGVQQVIGTDQDARALDCARDNLQRLGLAGQVQVCQADLFPPGRAGLVVCNPPWLPARAVAAIEHAVYDEDSRMLRGFLQGLPEHLTPAGEGWLVLSDFAEHLGLRTREQLLGWIKDAGLVVLQRHDIRPRHAKATQGDDALALARAAEVTSLWRLGLKAAALSPTCP
jgi:methylase of polypeptide subunit release factors